MPIFILVLLTCALGTLQPCPLGELFTEVFSKALLTKDLLQLTTTFHFSDVFLKQFWERLYRLRLHGENCVILVIYDSIRGLTVETQICSFKQNGLVGKHILFVAFDELSRRRAASLGMNPILFSSNTSLLLHERYWMKLVVSLFVLEMNMTCFLVDSDVIVLGNFSELWDDRWDLEFPSDSDRVLATKDFRLYSHNANTGLVKMKPTQGVIALLKRALRDRIPCFFDQALVARQLRKSIQFGDGWMTKNSNVTWRILEPLRAPTGGILFCRGKEVLRKLAFENHVVSPVIVHLNWHVPGVARGRTIRLLGWKVKNRRCPRISWPYWSTASLPDELRCVGPHVADVDPEDNVSLPMAP